MTLSTKTSVSLINHLSSDSTQRNLAVIIASVVACSSTDFFLSKRLVVNLGKLFTQAGKLESRLVVSYILSRENVGVARCYVSFFDKSETFIEFS